MYNEPVKWRVFLYLHICKFPFIQTPKIMEKEKLIIKHAEGNVEGIYINSGATTPLVIIVNGHNGFYNYGMFPYIQQKLYENKISSYSFNYSHGGVVGDSDRFEDLEKYEQNCMRLEILDLNSVIQKLSDFPFKDHHGSFLFAHSLGGVPAIFAAKKALEENILIEGLILVSAVSSLNFWPPSMITEWNSAGVFYKKNNRTLQQLPLGFEFLQEVLKSETTWNVKKNIEKLKLPILILHGEEDEAVPLTNGEQLFSWTQTLNNNSKFIKISNATHTYNTKHPFVESSPQLEEMLSSCVKWIRGIID